MRKRILIIDDEKDYTHFIKTNLELLGNFVVLTANRGRAGIRTTIKEKPHLILLDVIMPGMDGFRVLRKLKDNDKTYHIPVIMLTAKSEDEAKLKAAGLYCEDYIMKPVQTKILREKKMNALARSRESQIHDEGGNRS